MHAGTHAVVVDASWMFEWVFQALTEHSHWMNIKWKWMENGMHSCVQNIGVYYMWMTASCDLYKQPSLFILSNIRKKKGRQDLSSRSNQLTMVANYRIPFSPLLLNQIFALFIYYSKRKGISWLLWKSEIKSQIIPIAWLALSKNPKWEISSAFFNWNCVQLIACFQHGLYMNPLIIQTCTPTNFNAPPCFCELRLFCTRKNEKEVYFIAHAHNNHPNNILLVLISEWAVNSLLFWLNPEHTHTHITGFPVNTMTLPIICEHELLTNIVQTNYILCQLSRLII